MMSNLDLFVHTACAIAVIVIVARLLGSFMNYIGQPRVVGEMIAGVLLGPTLLSSVFPAFTGYLFKDTQVEIYILGNIGLSFYMFLVGMDIDFSTVDKTLRKQAGVLSVVATVIPFGTGMFSAYIFYDVLCLPGIPLFSFMFFTGTAFSIMAFPMLARILDEKNLIRTKLGSLSLLSASIQDVATWIMLAFVTAIASTGELKNGLVTLCGALAFVVLVFFIGKPLLKIVGNKVQKQGKITQNQFALVLICLLAAAIITDKVGLYSVFGGFILGLAMPRTSVFQVEIRSKLQDIMVVFFLPLFFAFSGLKTNFLVLFSTNLLVPCLVVLGLSIASKYVPVIFSMKACGYTWRQSSAMGGLITARGLMELIVANIGLDYKIIDQNMYSILVLIAVITTLGALPIYNLSLGKGIKDPVTGSDHS